jgi:hypothetical protein
MSPEVQGGAAHGLVGISDAGAFLARLTRLDAGALVRLRSSGSRTALWARLPWGVLVTREVAGGGPADATVSAAELLAELAAGGRILPGRRDGEWRWPLPPPGARPVESVASAELSRLAAAAAGTLREAAVAGVGGRAVGSRALRDALLDHVALVVTPPDGRPVEVSQRLVQAIFRMGFLGPSGMDVPGSQVCVAARWVGLSAPFGVAWLPTVNTLAVLPIATHPNG